MEKNTTIFVLLNTAAGLTAKETRYMAKQVAKMTIQFIWSSGADFGMEL